MCSCSEVIWHPLLDKIGPNEGKVNHNSVDCILIVGRCCAPPPKVGELVEEMARGGLWRYLSSLVNVGGINHPQNVLTLEVVRWARVGNWVARTH